MSRLKVYIWLGAKYQITYLRFTVCFLVFLSQCFTRFQWYFTSLRSQNHVQSLASHSQPTRQVGERQNSYKPVIKLIISTRQGVYNKVYRRHICSLSALKGCKTLKFDQIQVRGYHSRAVGRTIMLPGVECHNEISLDNIWNLSEN